MERVVSYISNLLIRYQSYVLSRNLCNRYIIQWLYLRHYSGQINIETLSVILILTILCFVS